MKDNHISGKNTTPGVKRIIEGAIRCRKDRGHEQLRLGHWLIVLLERHGEMAEELARGLEYKTLSGELREKLRAGDAGECLEESTVLETAGKLAQARGAKQIFERDIATAVLAAAGFDTVVTAEQATDVAHPGEQRGSGGKPGYCPRARRSTPTLDRFCNDLTRVAAGGKLTPVVARDGEMALVIETLCRRTKRNPVLVGPAGVGKTAIVEGLAQLIVRGDVPEPLRGARIIAMKPSVLLAGASYSGFNERVKEMLGEAAHDGILLFVDEIHTLVGTGYGRTGVEDLASLFKPVLARGEIACIGATTYEEYRQHIERDRALERRFQPLRVHELPEEGTRHVLRVVRDELAQLRGISVADNVLQRCIDLARSFLPNRFFPDKAIDLLEQCVAAATVSGAGTVGIADAENTIQKMVGMPVDIESRLAALRNGLVEHVRMAERDADVLVGRLGVTMRGLDLHPTRPNAVVLLFGPAAESGTLLGQEVARCLFGGPERVIDIDFGQLVESEHVSRLIGSPPGYVGYEDSLPLHEVGQMPWSVLYCRNVDSCHPSIRSLLAQGLEDGFITMLRGRRVYLSDTIVVLSAAFGGEAKPKTVLGFIAGDEDCSPVSKSAEQLRTTLGGSLLKQVDLMCGEFSPTGGLARNALETGLLKVLAGRMREQSVELVWDETVIDWLSGKNRSTARTMRECELMVERELLPQLVPHMRVAGEEGGVTLLVRRTPDGVEVEKIGK